MNETRDSSPHVTNRPNVVHPGPSAIEDLLRYIAPATDQATEEFVAAIYADRKHSLDPSVNG